ncbi:MAG: hypothetical protein HOF11_21325 [Rhodospirillaceae bacterium]|nr:hypothetical protein [Rhodospirillaceae bacterium]
MLGMTDTKTTDVGLDDLVRDVQPSQDPAYLAWRDAKIARALKAAEAAPERRIPQREIWKKFGLES